ncbi:PREDICTED: cytochrome P450 4d2-like [Atta cephalotes]|uniref:Cytochrome P450 n=1 Tax=Atta cephalotes TaxID=12957 RepID=A0A158P3G6_ATTCE|nr:PREDICTED: cytochrome P450 4d2-like [Atta cephalotes]
MPEPEHHVNSRRQINNIPSVPALPFIGHMLKFFWRSQEDLWKFQRQLCKDYYPIYKLWCGPIAFVSIHHPDDLEKVLSSTKEHLSKGYLYDSLIPWLGTGLLTSEGIKWHKRRKILTPTFHFNILKQFVEILINEGNRMVKFLKDTNGSVNDLMFLVSHHTMNAIVETAMGTSLQEMDEFQQYHQAIHDMGKIVIYRVLKPWLASNLIFSLTSMGKRQDKNLKILHGFTEKIIKERKQYHERTNGRYLKYFDDMTETDDEKIIGIKKRRLAMLDLLIAAVRNNEMNDLDIREEVDTFVFEGLSSTYLDIKSSETHLVPSGTILHLNIYDIHRDPNFWPNPDVFDPDRFLLEKIQKRHPYSYLPFSAGPRNCIGQRFAMMELKAIMATLIYNFYLEPIDYLKDLQFKTDLISRVTQPIRIRFIPINPVAGYGAVKPATSSVHSRSSGFAPGEQDDRETRSKYFNLSSLPTTSLHPSRCANFTQIARLLLTNRKTQHCIYDVNNADYAGNDGY